MAAHPTQCREATARRRSGPRPSCNGLYEHACRSGRQRRDRRRCKCLRDIPEEQHRDGITSPETGGARKESRCIATSAILRFADEPEKRVTDIIESVSTAAAEMNANARRMSANAEETSTQATAVASASEPSTSNVNALVAAIEEVTGNIDEITACTVSISSAVEEQIASTSETARNV